MRRADATIVGTVTGGGRPIVGASVELSDGRTSRTTATASTPNGGYTFTGVAPGQLHADRRGAGLRPADRPGAGRRRRRARSATWRWERRPDARRRHCPCSSSCRSASRHRSPCRSPTPRSLIDAYSVRAFGLDPQWMSRRRRRGCRCSPPRSASSRSPSPCRADFPAGHAHTSSVHVQSENDPTEFSLAQIALDVGTRSRTTLRVDPVTVTGGNSAQFALVVANEGNATVQARPMGVDPEDVVDIAFEPPAVVLPPGPARDRARRRPRRPAVVRPAQAAGAVVQPRSRRAAGDGDVRPAAAHRPLADLAARPGHGGRHLRPRAEHGRRPARRRGRRSTTALLNEALTQPGGGGGEAVSVTPSAVDRHGRRGQHRRGRRRRAGRAVLVGQRRRPAGQRGDRRAPAPTRSAACRPAATGVRFTGCRLRRAVVRRRRRRSPTPPTSRSPLGATVALDDARARRSPGQHRRRGDRRRPDRRRRPARRARAGRRRHQRARRGGGGVGRRRVPLRGRAVAGRLPAHRRQGGLRHRGPRRRAAAPPRTSRASRSSCARATVSSSGRVQSPSGPLGGVTVTATGGDIEVSTVSLTLDDVGSFAVRTLPTPGQYTLTFERDGLRVGHPHRRPRRRPAGVRPRPSTLAPTTGAISGTVSLGGVGSGRRRHRHA